MISIINDGQRNPCNLCRGVVGAIVIFEADGQEISACHHCLVTSLNKLNEQIDSVSELARKKGYRRK